MTWPWQRPSKLDAILAAQQEALQHVAQTATAAIAAVARTAQAQADASTAQANVLREWLACFKTEGPPEGHTIREADEVDDFLLRTGYPIGASAEEQAAWVLKQSEFLDPSHYKYD